jgi:glycosidase
MRTSLTSFSALALTVSLLATVAAACSDDNELKSWQPPSGTGGFNPGEGPSPSGSGSGAGTPISSGSDSSSSTSSGTGGGGGAGGSGPPMCDDSLKRCEHLFTYPASNETSVEVRGDFAPGAWMNGVQLTREGAAWRGTASIPYNRDVIYKFVIDGTTWVNDPNNPEQVPDGFGGFNSLLSAATCDPWTCEAPQLGNFDWRDSVMYFVFVDRFLDGNPANNGTPTGSGVQPPADYRGGDWAGVTQRIQDGYFTDLGVNTLWLSVPMDNTEQSGIGVGGDTHRYSAYHGYWPERLDQPEERFGTLAELQALVEAAHAADIKVILDYAMNHVHVSSPVYQMHMSDGWFWPLNDGSVSNCVCGAGCSWDGDQGRRCWFTDYLPDFNFTNAAAREFSVSNALWWIQQTNIDGLRLDAVKHIEDQWLRDLRSRVTAEIEPEKGEHFYMVGETFTGDRNTIAYYVNPATMLDGQFDFPLRAQVVASMLMRQRPMSDLRAFMDGYDNAYGAGIMSTFIGNHDVPRSIHFAQDTPLWDSEWHDGKNVAWSGQPSLPGGLSAFERLAGAFTLLFTTRGIPLIYYGDEVGLPGAGDPDNRRLMQWTGYSAGQTFLLNRIKKLTAIRAGHPALRRGTRQSLSATADTLAYKMTLGSEVVYVAINRGDIAQQVSGLPSGSLNELIGETSVSGPTVTIPARSSMVVIAP